MAEFVDNINLECRVSPEEFVRVARSYIGTPYSTQGRSRQCLDCGGLAIVVARDLEYTDLEVLGYKARPNGVDFEWIMEHATTEIPKLETAVGDVVAFDYGKGIQHIAIVSGVDPKIKIIHAKPKHGVVEQNMHGHESRSWIKTFRWKHLVAKS